MLKVDGRGRGCGIFEVPRSCEDTEAKVSKEAEKTAGEVEPTVRTAGAL